MPRLEIPNLPPNPVERWKICDAKRHCQWARGWQKGAPKNRSQKKIRKNEKNSVISQLFAPSTGSWFKTWKLRKLSKKNALARNMYYITPLKLKWNLEVPPKKEKEKLRNKSKASIIGFQPLVFGGVSSLVSFFQIVFLSHPAGRNNDPPLLPPKSCVGNTRMSPWKIVGLE